MIKRIINKYTLLILLVNIFTGLKGQNNDPLELKLPTTPQAAAFQKYGDHEINYQTGVPNISIPLYEINHRGYKIPLTLKYSPIPLKHGYNYDVYGHGWGLSVHGCVSRTIDTRPDEETGFQLQHQIFDQYYYLNGNPWDVHEYNLNYDLFNAVLPNGISFDFFIKKEGGQLVYVVPGDFKVKIECSYSSTNINSFTIVDEDGVKYSFSIAETGHSSYSSDPYSRSNVSWLLTRIDLPYSAEPITFTYGREMLKDWVPQPVEPEISILKNWCQAQDNIGCNTSATASLSFNSSYNGYRMKLLTAINYGGIQIDFSYTEIPQKNHFYVNNIQVKHGSIRRNIDLTMSEKTLYSTNLNFPLVKLDSVTIKGPDQASVPDVFECKYGTNSYTFQGTDHWGYLNNYYDGSNGYGVANFNFFVEFDPDWHLLLSSYAPLSHVEHLPGDPQRLYKLKLSTVNVDNRRPDEPWAHGVLEKLVYPTGGYTVFEFENHVYLANTDVNGDLIKDLEARRRAQAGGFRIRKIENYVSTGAVPEVEVYEYGKATHPAGQNIAIEHSGVGIAVVEPNIATYKGNIRSGAAQLGLFGYTLTEMILGRDQDYSVSEFFLNCKDWCRSFRWEICFSANNFRQLLRGRPPVLYDEVTVYHGNIDDCYFSDDDCWETEPPKITGKTVYKYNITEEKLDIFGRLSDDVFFEDHFINNTKEPYYNCLDEKIDYKLNGTEFIPVQKVNYSWEYQVYSLYSYIFKCPHFLDFCYPKYSTVGNFISDRSRYIGKARSFGESTITYSDDAESSIESFHNRTYNSRGQLKEISSQNSKGENINTQYWYPEIQESGTTPVIIQKMVDKNILSPVVKSTTKVNGSQTYGSITDYDEFTIDTRKIIMPARTYEWEVKPSGNEYVLKKEIASYSPNGKPLELVTQESIHTSYIWGYGDRYIVASIQNASYNTAGDIVCENNTFSKSKIDVISSGSTYELLLKLNEIRTTLTKAMVTTYTYAPLVGMTSETGPDGVTTYYEYDSFGRLQYIKDQDLNIIQEYKYHYKE
ncbi:MAG: hypothetical protein R6W78_09935 [Bacteroidales bacterium]